MLTVSSFSFELRVSQLLKFAVRELINWDCWVVRVSMLISWHCFSLISYALPACGLYLSAGQCDRINAFLKRACKCGFSSNLITVEQLLCSSATTFCNRMQNPSHSLHILLPSTKNVQYALRSMVLPKIVDFGHRKPTQWLRTDYTDFMTRPFLLSISFFWF